MFTYRRKIQSGNMLEVEIYQSIRPRNNKNVARGTRVQLSSEKQAQANIYNGIKRTQRLIANNFEPGDWWVKFGFAEPVTEEEAERLVNNFLARYKRYLAKKGKDLKYIGMLECGEKNSNWHLHLVIEKSDFDDLRKIWGYGGIYVEALYQQGNYYDLAKYIRKTVGGKKRLRQSRNLKPPVVTVTEVGKKSLRKLERGEMIEIPDGYYLQDDNFTYNELTGARYSFTFFKIETKNQTCRRRSFYGGIL